MKRARSRGRTTEGKKSRNASPRTVSPASSEDALPEEPRGRGRPVTTGKGVGIRAQKAAEKLAATERLIRTAEEIVKGGYELRDSRRRMAAKEEELGEEVKFFPIRDIAAELIKWVNSIDRLVTASGNLKGTFVKQIREAALYIKVATDALATRAMGEAPTLERE